MRHWIAFLALAASGSALAGQADICYSAATPNGQVDQLTSATALDCPIAGHHTLAELAQGGWAVAAIQPVTVDYRVNPATHSPESANAWMLVVQRGSK